MSTVSHKIILASDQNLGGKLPPLEIGLLLAQIAAAVRSAISMALRNRSTIHGGPPAWLDRAADIRFVDHQGDRETTLFFEAPCLGDAAQELYQQGEFWPTRPDASDTGFDLLGDVLSAVKAEDADSDLFDLALLKRLLRFRRVFERSFRQAEIESRRYDARHRAQLSPAILQTAQRLYANTPPPQRVRLVGTLDMVRASTQTFALKIAAGDEVRGVLLEGSIEELAGLLNRRVLVLGKAIYRVSGRVLRIDTEAFRVATQQDEFFSQLPSPPAARLDVKSMLREQPHKKGIRAIIGKWPGDESDEQIQQVLEELS